MDVKPERQGGTQQPNKKVDPDMRRAGKVDEIKVFTKRLG